MARPWPGGEKRISGRASHHEACEAMESLFLRGVPAHGVVPNRCHASGAAVDLCSAALAGAQWAGRAADGGVVDVPRALAVPPRAPCINAQALLDYTPIIPVTACHQSNYVETYSRYSNLS